MNPLLHLAVQSLLRAHDMILQANESTHYPSPIGNQGDQTQEECGEDWHSPQQHASHSPGPQRQPLECDVHNKHEESLDINLHQSFHQKMH